jgi:uncharacterized membrane protein YkvA (DUF1232 family)
MNNKKRELLNPQSGFFQNIVMQMKLILRLMGDKKVNFFLKILPVAALIYVISPVDLAPGLALPVIGALDDAAVLWLGTTLFVSLCPDEVVQMHKDALEKVIHGVWRDGGEKPSTEIIEVKPSEAPEEEGKSQS